jgi:hypothetical protein
MNYQVQVIKIGAVGGGTVTTNIFNNLRFQPDEMIVRVFTYEGDNAATSYQLWSNIIDDGFLMVFTSGGPNIGTTFMTPNLHYDVSNKKISGSTFTFQPQLLTSNILVDNAAVATGDWALLLEFRKYNAHK